MQLNTAYTYIYKKTKNRKRKKKNYENSIIKTSFFLYFKIAHK